MVIDVIFVLVIVPMFSMRSFDFPPSTLILDRGSVPTTQTKGGKCDEEEEEEKEEVMMKTPSCHLKD